PEPELTRARKCPNQRLQPEASSAVVKKGGCPQSAASGVSNKTNASGNPAKAAPDANSGKRGAGSAAASCRVSAAPPQVLPGSRGAAAMSQSRQLRQPTTLAKARLISEHPAAGRSGEHSVVLPMRSLNKKYDDASLQASQVLSLPRCRFDECGHRCGAAAPVCRIAQGWRPGCPLRPDAHRQGKDNGVRGTKRSKIETDNLGVKCSFYYGRAVQVDRARRAQGAHAAPGVLRTRMHTVCPMRCGAEFEKRFQQKHRDEDCPKTAGQEAGAAAHLKENQITHMELLCVALAGIERRIACLEKLYGPQLVWRIDSYQERLAEAKSGKKTTLFSPPFLTHRYGYKLILSTCFIRRWSGLYLQYLPFKEQLASSIANSAGRGEYMSVFLSICKSENDPLLIWPFGHRVTIWLLDQCEDVKARRHISYSLKPNTCKENRPFLGRPIGRTKRQLWSS
uniref:TRAF-type domain-containing protein n=1 Tax=Macrostomum lignano TaxID=282301 RepID=A0A1I8FJ31_9PLAT